MMPKYVAVILLVMFVSVTFADSVTYCINNSTLRKNETFVVCGSSPVLNPLGNDCYTYQKTKDVFCSNGCDSQRDMCIPSDFNRLILIMVIVMFVVVIVAVMRRYL